MSGTPSTHFRQRNFPHPWPKAELPVPRRGAFAPTHPPQATAMHVVTTHHVHLLMHMTKFSQNSTSLLVVHQTLCRYRHTISNQLSDPLSSQTQFINGGFCSLQYGIIHVSLFPESGTRPSQNFEQYLPQFSSIGTTTEANNGVFNMLIVTMTK